MIAKLLEITQIGSTRAGIFDLPSHHWPQPGQFLPCQRPSEPAEVLPTNLFKVFSPPDVLVLAPLPANWYPGDQFSYLAPQGKGFSLPPSARRVGLLPLSVSPARLLTLVKPALDQGASVTLFADLQHKADFLNQLPAMVEVAPLAILDDYIDWLDYLAVDLEREDLERLSALFPNPSPLFDGQVLIHTPMPCRGLGTCGVCSLRTTKGWRLACKDGPVFPLQEVLHVAQ